MDKNGAGKSRELRQKIRQACIRKVGRMGLSVVEIQHSGHNIAKRKSLSINGRLCLIKIAQGYVKPKRGLNREYGHFIFRGDVLQEHDFAILCLIRGRSRRWFIFNSQTLLKLPESRNGDRHLWVPVAEKRRVQVNQNRSIAKSKNAWGLLGQRA